jgi:bifunctional non-homologous end joining protein LigD
MSELLQQLSQEEQSKAQETGMPEWVEPMLARLTKDHFNDENWIYERKFDGERIFAYVAQGGDVRLVTRNRKRANESYPELEEALGKQTNVPCVLDGEVVALNEKDISDFQLLQSRMQVSDREDALATGVRVRYYLFDCPYIDGFDVSACSLRSRKKLLKEAVDWDDPLYWTAHRNEEGLAYYDEACQKGWEGVIAKDARSEYVHSRSSKWLKFKCVREQEFVIGGYTEPKGEREGFGALLLGFYRNDSFIYAGKVGTGFDHQTLLDLSDRLIGLERKTSPFDQGDEKADEVHFVTPKLVCQIGFTEWTDSGKLRHPRYKGLRRDKEPEDVHREA